MKEFDELTKLGRVRRMRRLARVALDTYGLGEARFRFLLQAGNTLFRVWGSDPTGNATDEDLFETDQYLLRIHNPGDQASDAIKLELAWLAAIRRDADLPVPEPVPTPDDALVTRVTVPGIQGARDCSLLRWLKGRFVTTGIRPHHFRAQGRLMARLHDHAANWQPPPGLTKRRLDWDGLFSDDSGAGIPARKVWPLLSDSDCELFKIVADKVRRVMDEWGTGPEVYGLIHADCGVDANVLFRRGEARIIDFDGSGFGYWIFDLAVALEHCWEDAAFPQYRQALLEGYSEIRPLPETQVGQMELFLAAFYVYITLWATGAAHRNPDSRRWLVRWRRRAVTYIERYLAGS